MAREKMGKLPEALVDLTAACMLSGFQNEMATSNTDRLIKEVGHVRVRVRVRVSRLIKEVGRLTTLLSLSLSLTLTLTLTLTLSLSLSLTLSLALTRWAA